MPSRGAPLVTALRTTVSPYCARIAASACFASCPVSKDNTLLPICFSTRTFTSVPTLSQFRSRHFSNTTNTSLFQYFSITTRSLHGRLEQLTGPPTQQVTGSSVRWLATHLSTQLDTGAKVGPGATSKRAKPCVPGCRAPFKIPDRPRVGW